jgi:hypothetical protein
MDVFDTKSGNPVVIDNPEQIREGILSGEFGFKKNSKVNVFKGEEVYEVPAPDVYNALKNGWEIETPNITAVREYLKENDNLVGSLKVGAYEFANALTFGVPDIVMRNTGNPLEWAKLNALRDEHITASLLGEVSGLGANIYSLARAGVLAATEKISEKAVNVVANRISAILGQGVSKSAANQAARGILAKTASKLGQGVGIVGRNVGQGAIEGALDMAIPASVEALFGNYDEAAETLLVGTAFGGLFGGTLRTAGDSINSAKDALFKSSTLGEGSKIQESFLQLASTYTNIPIETLRYGLKNAKEVDNALPIISHFDNLNTAAATEYNLFQTAKNELKDIEDTLIAKTRIKATQMDDLARAPNKGIDDEIMSSTSQMKNWLEENSYVAEEALSNEIPLAKIDLRKYQRNLQSSIDNLSKGKVGKTIGRTLSNLEGISNDFAALDNFVDGNTARSVLRNIREEIKFNEADPAVFDSALDKVLKNLQKDLSDTIKTYSPTYKKQMDSMAPKAQALEFLRPLISTQSKRLSVGAALATETPTASQQALLNRMENFFKAAEDIEGLENIRDVFNDAIRDQRSAQIYKKNRKSMLDAKTSQAKEDFYKVQFPTEFQIFEQKKAALGQATIDWEALKPLVTTDGRVLESNIKITDDKKFIALDRAYDELAKRYPSQLGDIKRQIKATMINKAFEKARPQGSRATLLFGSLGAATGISTGVVGSVLGGAIGATTGAYIDRFGGKLISKILKDTPVSSKIRSLLVAEKQMNQFAQGLGNIPTHINKIATKKDQSSAYRKLNRATNHVLFRILDREKEQPKDELLDRETRVEAFRKFSNKLSSLSGNPDNLFEELSAVAGATTEGGSSTFGAKTMEKMSLGIAYLQKEIPKDPNPEMLFVKKGQEWEPSEYDLRAFEEKLTVLNDPFIVFDALEADLLTENYISALKEVYPSLYGHISRTIFESLSTDETSLNYTEKVGLSQIIGIPLDASMTAESFAFFQPVSEEEQQQQQIKNKNNNQLAKIKIDTSKYMSQSSRLRNI